jgi:hypothetical protein
MPAQIPTPIPARSSRINATHKMRSPVQRLPVVDDVVEAGGEGEVNAEYGDAGTLFDNMV